MFKDPTTFAREGMQAKASAFSDAPSGRLLAGGNWPVVLTPFTQALEIDWTAYAALVRFYLERGAGGLFAVCHSSEMDFLTEEEILQLVRETVRLVDGRVGVVASLGKCRSLEDYAARAAKVAALGVDAVVFTCSTLVEANEPDELLVERVLEIAEGLPVPVGLYEAPLPYHRLLSDAAFEQLAHSGKVTFFKDTCCDAQRIARRVELSKGTPLRIFNAHMPSLPQTLQAGVAGYSGIGSNYFPELYSRLCACYAESPELASGIHAFVLEQEPQLIEGNAYPSTAKHYIRLRGVPLELYARKPCLSVLEEGIAARQQPFIDQLNHFLRTHGITPDAAPHV